MAFLPFPKPLVKAVFLRRYKRFLADMRLENGDIVVAHCPNTGSMRASLQENAPAVLSFSNDPKRKTRYSWKAIRISRTWVGIDTMLPNRLVEAAIRAGEIPALQGYEGNRPRTGLERSQPGGPAVAGSRSVLRRGQKRNPGGKRRGPLSRRRDVTRAKAPDGTARQGAARRSGRHGVPGSAL